ncbi:MAG: signal peptidase II [Bauldia sp.]
MTDRAVHPALLAPPGPASRTGIIIIASVLIADQIAKWVAQAALDWNTPIDVLPFLGLYLTTNPGIAFSFLRGSNTALLLGAVVVITLLVLFFWARARDGGRLAALGFGLIVGGAVGNIVDRIIYGHVIDFLRLFLGDRTFFVFNLADVALTFGPIILVLAYLRVPRSA